MPKDSPEPSSHTPGIIVALLLLISAVGVRQIPLESSRPHHVEKVKNRIVGLEDVDARLWQDPFAAVNRYIKEKKPQDFVFNKSGLKGTVKVIRQNEFEATVEAAVNPENPHNRLSELQRKMAQAEGKLIVLAAMVIGGPYPADEEHRRRMRYAVVSGLAASDYFPDDPDHIGYIGFPFEHVPHLPEYVPYEWFTAKTSETSAESGGRLLLLWLDDHAFKPESQVQTTTKLAHFVKQIAMNRCNANNSSVDFPFSILGLAGSSNLINMISELREEQVKDIDLSYLEGVTFYSPTATALDEQWQQTSIRNKNGDTQHDNISDIQHVFNQKKIGFLSTIGTDSDLTDGLIGELALRGVDTTCNGKKRGDHIAVVSEVDTDYARLLRKTLTGSMLEQPKDKNAHQEKLSTSPNDCRIWNYSYQRGLDGQYLDAAPAPEADQFAKDRKDKFPDTENIERAEGNSQMDYLRRLTASMYNRNQELRRSKKGEIKAIGILGSDLYDKLLVLQALRGQFPNAIFFTTDLDSRLLHPRETKWTRNLIVASHFGFELNDMWQKDILPFRDSYQTATYLATRLATDMMAKEPRDQERISRLLKQQELLNKSIQPRIFEIGRTEAVEFSTKKNELEEAKCDLLPSGCSLYRNKPDLSRRSDILIYGLYLFLASVGFLLLFSKLRRRVANTAQYLVRRSALVIALTFAITLILYMTSLVWLERHDGEPFAWFEGISLWPTELLRIIAIGMSIYFLYKAYTKVHRSNRELTDIFFDGKRVLLEYVPTLNDFRTWGKACAVVMRIYRWEATSNLSGLPDQNLDVNEFWKKQVYHDSVFARLWRIVPVSILSFFIHYFIVTSFGMPHLPFRGDVIFYLNQTIIYLMTFLFIVLIFYVTDTIRLCKLLIQSLCETSASWSNTTRSRFGINTRSTRADMEHYFDDWISIQLIARRTQTVGPLIYYPIIICTLMLIARSPVFDNWDMPIGLTLVYAASVAIALMCAIVLRLAAEKARKKALGHLVVNLLRLKGQGNDVRPITEQLELVGREIETIHEGAFAPFTQQPVIKALIALTGGYSGFALLEYLALTNI